MRPIGNSGVTLETHRIHVRTGEQARVRGTVRSVTGLATFGLHRRVLEYKWTFLIAVAVEANGILSRSIAELPTGARVNIVTVGTGNQTFIHAVPEGLVEIGFDL